MASVRVGNSLAVAACLVPVVLAQDQADACYGPGSVVGAVLGTLIVTLGVLLSGFFMYKIFWKSRKGKHLVLSDAEIPHDQFAFDNPCFREAAPIKHSIQDETQNSKLEKTKWPGWPPVHTFGKEKTEKITSMDDSHLKDSRVKMVTLKSHDFTGLGFNICGNMRDGIFVKDVLHRGPAFESGCINTGDRIHSVCISFRNMVFEDALTILSYASPYDVQVQVENDSYSRPSTLMRSKRESSVVNSSDKIFHPKFSRSQSISHLNEIGKDNNRKLTHQIDFMQEKNRVNHHLLNKPQDFGSNQVNKVSSPTNDEKLYRNVNPKVSSIAANEKSPKGDGQIREFVSPDMKLAYPQNKLQKLGIKVLPISINPKMGVQSVTGNKKPAKSPTSIENEINLAKEKPEKSRELSRSASPVEESVSGVDDPDANKENMKAMLAKGFFNLKEKINQNTLGKKKKEEENQNLEERWRGSEAKGNKNEQENDCPVPKLRSSITNESGMKDFDQVQQNHVNVPEEVSRAGDVARNNRKSIAEARRKSISDAQSEKTGHVAKLEGASESEGSSDVESSKDDTKKQKKSKGKAPPPPKKVMIPEKMSEINNESELIKNEPTIFEPDSVSIPLKNPDDAERSARLSSYDSDSDTEPIATTKDNLNTKIELNATQITVHQSSTEDANEDEAEPSRKAASLGDLSKLDSDQPLSIVLERAVSLDLTEGTSQCGKKRKAPLPPSEEFPAVFDDLNYRKEPRLEGLNTFQRRLKKSSDFGTLEDALYDGPKSLEIEVNKHSPFDLTETHNYNIQEFSSWLAECRRPKTTEGEAKSDSDRPEINSTSLVNINSFNCVDKEKEAKGKYDYQGSNVSFSVNGKNFVDFEVSGSPENGNFSETNSRTVVVISQPSSLEPAALEKGPVGNASKEANGTNEPRESSETSEEDGAPPKLPTSPMPTSNTSNTLSSPLSSALTYITEIKVSTSDANSEKLEPGFSTRNSLTERIQKFDSSRAQLDTSTSKNNFSESSKIPIRAMKSETGQKVLATIESLAKESCSAKTPEVEYAKRIASLFSGPQKSELNIRKSETTENEISVPNISGLYLKSSPPKPSKDYSPTRKVPPVVPPRKMESSLSGKSTVTVELSPPPSELQERNVVTFSSFVGRNQNEEPGAPSGICFKIKERAEMNGREESAVPAKSAAKIVFESQQSEGV